MCSGTGEFTNADDVVEVVNPSGSGAFVIVCEHASNVIPPELHALGLDADVLSSHVAWDPGAHEVALAMAAQLDAPLVAQRISRLVYDCNRIAGAPSAIPASSEVYTIPGNADLDEAECRARAERYYVPFHDTIGAILDARMARGVATALLTVHSFTPVFHGVARDFELGVLHDSDARLANAVAAAAREQGGLTVRLNAPYGPEDGVTFTLTEHALPRGIPNVMLEIRNDLIADADAQKNMAQLLSGCVTRALAGIETSSGVAKHA